MQGFGRLQESRTARSPFMVLNSLQHSCLTRCRPVLDQCRKQIFAGAHNSATRYKLQHACNHSSNGHRAYSTTTCHASAAVADPAVTGEEQQDAIARTSDPQLSVSSAYPFTELEAKWQHYWSKHKTFKTPDFKDLDTSKPKFYALDMFPYPR